MRHAHIVRPSRTRPGELPQSGDASRPGSRGALTPSSDRVMLRRALCGPLLSPPATAAACMTCAWTAMSENSIFDRSKIAKRNVWTQDRSSTREVRGRDRNRTRRRRSAWAASENDASGTDCLAAGVVPLLPNRAFFIAHGSLPITKRIIVQRSTVNPHHVETGQSRTTRQRKGRGALGHPCHAKRRRGSERETGGDGLQAGAATKSRHGQRARPEFRYHGGTVRNLDDVEYRAHERRTGDRDLGGECRAAALADGSGSSSR